MLIIKIFITITITAVISITQITNITIATLPVSEQKGLTGDFAGRKEKLLLAHYFNRGEFPRMPDGVREGQKAISKHGGRNLVFRARDHSFYLKERFWRIPCTTKGMESKDILSPLSISDREAYMSHVWYHLNLWTTTTHTQENMPVFFECYKRRNSLLCPGLISFDTPKGFYISVSPSLKQCCKEGTLLSSCTDTQKYCNMLWTQSRKPPSTSAQLTTPMTTRIRYHHLPLAEEENDPRKG